MSGWSHSLFFSLALITVANLKRQAFLDLVLPDSHPQ